MIFSRRSQPTGRPDRAFPFLPAEAADRFRALVRDTFARAGVAVEVHPDHAVDPAGAVFGLADLAALCRGVDETEWPRLVEQHVRQAIELAGAPSPLRKMAPADVLTASWARVVPTDPTTLHRRPLTDDLSAVLALDLPDSVRFLDDADVQRVGADDLWRAGYANLRALRTQPPEPVTDGGATIQVLVDDSFFTASQVLVFDELLDRLGYRPDPTRGVFVSLPSRHELHFHVLSDPSCIPALGFMARFAAIRFQNSEGPLSPAVHWWRPGALTAASRVDADGVQIVVDGDLAEVMDGLIA